MRWDDDYGVTTERPRRLTLAASGVPLVARFMVVSALASGAGGGGGGWRRSGVGSLVANSSCAPCGAEPCCPGGEVGVAPFKDVGTVCVAATGLESAAP
jgi:hypothetical protein